MGAGLHRRTTDRKVRSRAPGIVTGLVLVVALGGVGTAIAIQRGSHSSPGSGPGAPGGNNGSHSSTTTTAPPAPLRITSVSPTPGTVDASFDTDVTVDFSQPLASNSPLPTLSPSPPGRWVKTGPKAVRFEPRGFFAPFAKVQLKVPGGPSGVLSRYGQHLSSTLRNNFAIQGGSELRLQQLLAELLYLPVKFVPTLPPTATTVAATSPSNVRQASTTTTTPPPPPSAIDTEPVLASEVPVNAVAGHFVWRFADPPASLASLWKAGQPNVITTGAIMAFESAHNLTTDGAAGPEVWAALLGAVAKRQVTTAPYDYVAVSQNLPETATVWRNGQIIFTTLVNTGIPVAPTAVGTYPVYARYLVTTMSGKNPDGTPYSDPGIPWVSYFNGGDALHGFIRASYGFPQSLGCVEMTYANAETMFPLTPLGTLVTVL